MTWLAFGGSLAAVLGLAATRRLLERHRGGGCAATWRVRKHWLHVHWFSERPVFFVLIFKRNAHPFTINQTLLLQDRLESSSISVWPACRWPHD